MLSAKELRSLTENAHAFWLMKSEPSECSIDDALAAPDRRVSWFGVRNYQARNFMRDAMSPGDAVLFYHSSCPNPGIAGIARIASGPYPDRCQFDPGSDYFDAKSTPENPRWIAVDVEGLAKIPVIPISDLRAHPELAEMIILRRGNRLSITPVTQSEFRFITERLVAQGD
ncbi:EVE domain-containing protein [Sutterella sp.]|uniref:EVE domain-containing protein n=1 Tax=Sutterella sp. TaxID=1981025 RepID=UPI0026E10622|nr:EVE domain-containing protein [Sutterella sp.]MDO5532523.1 EVE domain-containing protein [Sutterella sp.]